jgi:uncharacterized protein YjbI with pentapeptide repeats
MYVGDKGFTNKLVINTTEFSHDVIVNVYKASKAIGTCYQFPCDPRDLAEGLEDAVLVVFQQRNPKISSPLTLGTSLVFGGTNNLVIIDGKEVAPTDPFESLTTEQLQAIINQRKASSQQGELVDLTDLAQIPLKGRMVDFGYNKHTANYVEVFENLDFSGTNFAKTFNISGKYFCNCNFAGCRFGDTENVVFDGCDLTGADMSGTVQSGMRLSADTSFISRSISAIDSALHSLTGQDYAENYTTLQLLKNRLAEVRPTNFSRVNLKNATLQNPSDNYLTNYEGTDFKGVKITYDQQTNPKVYSTMMGKNLDLKGALYDLGNGQYFEINNPLSAEEVGQATNEYVKAMLRNNILDQRAGKETVIAIASGVGSEESEYRNRCNDIYDTDTAFAPVNVGDLQEIVNFYSQKDEAYNVRYVLYEPGLECDFVLRICKMVNIGNGGQESSYHLLKPEMFISVDADAINDPITLLHEKNHNQGAINPIDGGIAARKCSAFASVMCYQNGLDVTIPLGNHLLPITLHQPIDYGEQDHLANLMIFGRAPNYVGRDRNNEISFNQSRIIRGDANFNNTGFINLADLPKDYSYKILDAAKSLGSCYRFPCDVNDLAAGVAGTLVVFYPTDENSGKPSYGTLLHGGKTNSVVVNSPTKSPTNSPTFLRSADKEKNQAELFCILSSLVGVAIIAGCVARCVLNQQKVMTQTETGEVHNPVNTEGFNYSRLSQNLSLIKSA